MNQPIRSDGGLEVSEAHPPDEPGAATWPERPTHGAAWRGRGHLSPGSVVAGRYRLVHRLGRGGMGEVYRADDERLGQRVALKFLPLASSRDPGLRQRFLDEVRLARRVSHPNVCRVYDVGWTRGTLFLSMELIDGEDLRTLFERGPLPPEQAAGICVQICRGLAAIHERGLLHRDLKPANVMIDAGGQARVTDFGLAEPADPPAADPARGGSPDGLSVRGTLAYLAPELLLGEPATMRSDLYALGLLIHELFTGRRVYPWHSPLELARRRRDPAAAVPPAELQLEGDLDPAVARVVRWCLEREPRNRPASAEAVEAALRPDAGRQPGTFLATLVASDAGGGGEQKTRELLAEHGGREVATAEGAVWLFERPWGAVSSTLAWRRSAPAAGRARVGIHLGEVTLERRGRDSLCAVGPEVAAARRLAAIARPGQTLLTPHAFDLARHHSVGESAPEATVRWLSHGRYHLAGREEAIEVCEVGLEGAAPFLAPESSDAVRPEPDGSLSGWRPAPGTAIPQRPGWRIERKLGAGGFGDVWLARSIAGGEPRVFKFCYDLARLRALQREITIVRLLAEELGQRTDITRVIDWSFDRAPYFIESEYTLGGSLPEWAEGQGGIDRVPLAVRLEIVAQVATALAAAHSVGVLHKDVEPGNVLIATGDDGEFRAQLCDFGLGVVADRDRLAAAGITVRGLTETAPAGGSSTAGTPLYLAPELLEGKPPTLRSDLYALGVILYQMAIGDLTRALAPGWQRDVDDATLCEDIAAAVDGSPHRRLGDAARLAERLRSLEGRRAERAAEERARRRSERARRRRRIMAAALGIVAVFAVAVSAMAWRVAREAERAAQEARAAEQVAEFLVGMFETTDPFATAPAAPREGTTVTARDVLDQGARRLETELVDQPEIRARLIGTIGRVYLRLGLYGPAQTQFEKALALRRATLGEEHPAVAESLHDLAWVLHVRGEEDDAEALLLETLALRRATLGPEHLYVANTLHDLAWVLHAKGDLDAAERLSGEALAIKRRLPGDTDRAVAASLNHRAFLLFEKGEPEAAEPLAREALAITRRLWGEHPDVAESLNGLARVLLAKGEAPAAEPLAREALAMRRRLLGDDHPDVAQSLHDLAAVLIAEGRYPAAEPLLEESLARYRRLGDDHPGVAMAEDTRAALYRAWGRPGGAAEAQGSGAGAGGAP